MSERTTIKELIDSGKIGLDTVVLGELPITADGCVACQNAVVWHPVAGACYPVPDGLNMAAKVYGGTMLHDVGACYSTREAAEAQAMGFYDLPKNSANQ